ncbi:MAG TPA: glycosyltransferase family 4 protein [bacterium]|nr:glycosyltransferase family 4 protein [bacterium]
MRGSPKKVLVLTYYFPPAGGPGVQRVLKFVKYLPAYGWNPVVLTVKNGEFPARDDSLLAELPQSLPVHRVGGIEPYNFYRWITGKRKDQTLPVGMLAKQGSDTFMEGLARWIRANLFIPDGRTGWIRPVFRMGARAITQQHIQAIYSSSPPHSTQLAALWLAKHFQLPWVADFRDPWTDIYYYQTLPRLSLAKKIDGFLEQKVLAAADSVISVSPSILDKLHSRTKRGSFQVIYNGYDEQDFTGSPAGYPRDKFVLSYVGNLKANQNPEALWKALQLLSRENQEFHRDLEMHFTGRTHPQIIETLNQYQLLPSTVIEKYVPHSEAVKRMKATAVLLFIIPEAPENQGILTGKLFDYLAAEKPFLSLGPPDGDAARILADTGAGQMIDPQNLEAIKNRILYLYQLWKARSLQNEGPDPARIRQFSRRQLTAQLAGILYKMS